MLCTIVGAGPGVGAALGHRFARGGCRVALIARNRQTLDPIVAGLTAVCGIIPRGGLFDPDRIALIYWALHAEVPGAFSREVVYLPEGADAYYNDPCGAHRGSSDPIVASWR